MTSQLEFSSTPISYLPILLSELSPAKLSLFNPHIVTFVQTSCPRLSIDWGYAFEKPLLNPYECAVAIGVLKGWNDMASEEVNTEDVYPMDFYEGGSLWAVARTTGSF
jgi:2-(3-amino-3-carboxypropyl)histidine synthase